MLGLAEALEALDPAWTEGEYGGTQKLIAQLDEQRSSSEYVSAYNLARSYDDAGNTEKAMWWLEKAYEQRVPNLPYVQIFPVSAELRRDPRFLALLEKMDLPMVESTG